MIRHTSVVVVRSSSTISNIFCSTCPIKLKFYVEPPWVVALTFCSQYLGHMTKMAATPIHQLRTLQRRGEYKRHKLCYIAPHPTAGLYCPSPHSWVILPLIPQLGYIAPHPTALREILISDSIERTVDKSRYASWSQIHFSFLVHVYYPRRFEEKWSDIVFGFPPICPFVP